MKIFFQTTFEKFGAGILEILFPAFCVNCRQKLSFRQNFICEQCLLSIEINTSFFCPVCRRRLPDIGSACAHSRGLILAAVSNYSNPAVRSLLFALKYRSFKKIIELLDFLMDKYLLNLKYSFEGYSVVPIPLHRSKINPRGFNQAAVIAGLIAQKSSLPVINALTRIKSTKPQSKMKDYSARFENVRDCFAVQKGAFLNGKKIILVDDVFTTGATAQAAAKILKENGAKKIVFFVVAKA